MRPIVHGRTLFAWACALCLPAPPAGATDPQPADPLAMLYSPQLQFSVYGDPLIKIGLVEGLDEVSFQADVPLEILPLGAGGPAITLPADTPCRVHLLDGAPGAYRYWAIVGRVLPGDRDGLAALRQLWESRGQSPRSFNLGTFFAIHGNPFDNRQTVLGVGGSEDRAEIDALGRTLEEEYGVPRELHVERVAYPTGELALEAADGSVSVRHRDLLWVAIPEDGEFTIDGAAFGDGDEPAPDRRFVGSLAFTLDRTGRLVVVNELPAERLLEGIVPAEIYPSAPLDALRAQAVAARGELLADLGVRYLADPYMTCADVRCQVYSGVGAENERTSQAVADTRGVVLLHADHLARTVYSASCGGSSGDYASTWGADPIPYLTYHIDAPVVPDAFQAGVGEAGVEAFLDTPIDAFDAIEGFGGSRTHRWTVDLDGAALTEAVNATYPVGRVTALEVLRRDPSGRAVELRIAGQDGEVVVERELPIRRALGGLRSALFALRVEPGADGTIAAVNIRGGGYGHGVGLCQTGAIGAAQSGLDYVQILSHYYPGTDAVQLWE